MKKPLKYSRIYYAIRLNDGRYLIGHDGKPLEFGTKKQAQKQKKCGEKVVTIQLKDITRGGLL
jgi:hypothetical protein